MGLLARQCKRWTALTKAGWVRPQTRTPWPLPSRYRKKPTDLQHIQDAHDPHVMDSPCFGLGQVWFRALPEPLLHHIDIAAVQASETEQQALDLVAALPAPQHALLTWLTDVLCSVALNEVANKMSVRALATVVGPNLYHDGEATQFLSAMESLRFSQNLISFFTLVVAARLRVHQEQRSALSPVPL